MSSASRDRVDNGGSLLWRGGAALIAVALPTSVLAHAGGPDDPEGRAFTGLIYFLLASLLAFVTWLGIFIYGVMVFRDWKIGSWLSWMLLSNALLVCLVMGTRMGWAAFILIGAKLAVDFVICRFGRSARKREAEEIAGLSNPEEVLRAAKQRAGRPPASTR